MKIKKITVIVSAYNAKKYINKCLDSIVNQTYKNIEIIVVNDCSTDNTKKILGKYKNIILIDNLKNSGAAFSRNKALEKATGDFIGFVDADDYIDNNYYEVMVNNALKNDADLVIAPIKVVYEKSKNYIVSSITDENGFSKFNFINTGLAASPCNKIFKKELIINYPFLIGKMNEDVPTVIPSIVKAKKICLVNDVFYYYIQHDESVQNASFTDKKFDIFDSVDLCLKRINGCKDYDRISAAIIYNQIILLLIYVIVKEKNKKYRYHILKKYSQLSKKYDLRHNNLFWNFMASCGKKHAIYYRTLFRYVANGEILLANNLISIYDLLAKYFKPGSVIKEDISAQKVVEMAKYQASLPNSKIKVSVVIPNYNYARFMYQRLYSILRQNYKLYELIILDDCSKDESRDIIDGISKELKKYINLKVIYNDKNSGSAFKQWQKGFNVATGDYVWIAEADDYCEHNLISTIIKPCMKDANIIISYCDTAFINVLGFYIMRSIKPEIDIQKSQHWDKSYVNNGIKEIMNYSYLNCTIANVSSCLIKNGHYDDLLKESGKYHQVGDWLFYVNLMSLGNVAYNSKVLNYYRMHGDNVSSVTNHQKVIDEIRVLHAYFIKKFNLDDVHF